MASKLIIICYIVAGYLVIGSLSEKVVKPKDSEGASEGSKVELGSLRKAILELSRKPGKLRKATKNDEKSYEREVKICQRQLTSDIKTMKLKEAVLGYKVCLKVAANKLMTAGKWPDDRRLCLTRVINKLSHEDFGLEVDKAREKILNLCGASAKIVARSLTRDKPFINIGGLRLAVAIMARKVGIDVDSKKESKNGQKFQKRAIKCQKKLAKSSKSGDLEEAWVKFQKCFKSATKTYFKTNGELNWRRECVYSAIESMEFRSLELEKTELEVEAAQRFIVNQCSDNRSAKAVVRKFIENTRQKPGKPMPRSTTTNETEVTQAQFNTTATTTQASHGTQIFPMSLAWTLSILILIHCLGSQF